MADTLTILPDGVWIRDNPTPTINQVKSANEYSGSVAIKHKPAAKNIAPDCTINLSLKMPDNLGKLRAANIDPKPDAAKNIASSMLLPPKYSLTYIIIYHIYSIDISIL